MASSQNTQVIELDDLAAAALERELLARRFEFRTVPHARFSAKGEGVVCTVYKSGKCVVQGPGAEQFTEHYLPGNVRPPRLDDPASVPRETTVGSDECGKGDYFGPLVVVAAAFGPQHMALLEDARVEDSKNLSARAIRDSADVLRVALPHHAVVLMPERYNELYPRFDSLNDMLAWAHAAAIDKVLEATGAGHVVIDQFAKEKFVRARLKERARSAEVVIRPRAEENLAVAAASILASDIFTRSLWRLGKDVDLTLPKGAGPPVDSAAKRLVAVKGTSVLTHVAKLHFKTTDKVLGGAGR